MNIKYRIWDAILEEYLLSDDFYLLRRDGILVNPERVYVEGVNIELCSNVLDSKQKLIYEGDIVETVPNHITNALAIEPVVYTKGIVVFQHGCFKIQQENVGSINIDTFVSCHCCGSGLRIIGNIHDK
jgi:hypothetical protein